MKTLVITFFSSLQDLFLIQFATETSWEMDPDGKLEARWHLEDQMREHFILGLQKARSG